ncbi:MAG: hypothetical protein ABF969_01110 [Sporolactobacillus sp.]
MNVFSVGGIEGETRNIVGVNEWACGVLRGGAPFNRSVIGNARSERYVCAKQGNYAQNGRHVFLNGSTKVNQVRNVLFQQAIVTTEEATKNWGGTCNG